MSGKSAGGRGQRAGTHPCKGPASPSGGRCIQRAEAFLSPQAGPRPTWWGPRGMGEAAWGKASQALGGCGGNCPGFPRRPAAQDPAWAEEALPPSPLLCRLGLSGSRQFQTFPAGWPTAQRPAGPEPGTALERVGWHGPRRRQACAKCRLPGSSGTGSGSQAGKGCWRPGRGRQRGPWARGQGS